MRDTVAVQIALFVATLSVDTALAVITPQSDDLYILGGHGARPVVVSDANGNFVVAWEAHTEDSRITHVVGQRLGPDGAHLGSEFQIDAGTGLYHSRPQMGRAADGSLLVVWSVVDLHQPPRIEGRRLTADGEPVGAEFQMNDTPVGEIIAPTVAASGADFVVVWSGGSSSIYAPSIYGRMVAGEGPSGEAFIVNALNAPDVTMRHQPDVASLPDGFVVVWAAGTDYLGDSQFHVNG